jgi:predicted nucleic acid-binding protein
MIVADTNIIVYLTLDSDFTAAAEALYEKDQIWAAPLLWKSEFLNALALYLRKRLLTVDRAFEILHEAEAVIGPNEVETDAREVLRLATESGHPTYDYEFVALAQTLGVPLITTDKKLLRAFPKVAISLAAATSMN